jgi:hypothetical protein
MDKKKELFILAIRMADEQRKLQKQMAVYEFRLRELLRFVGEECNLDMTGCLNMWKYYQRENTVSSVPMNSIEDLYDNMVNHGD